ncbi:hypothetical protein ACQ4M4_25505 [Leptolyngbya sp. AN02str]|uniref:hypothetical protein n=1 Tax=Leptolyngbya sp. AN02str TaxID=3423363 RepID=UPI003D3217D3
MSESFQKYPECDRCLFFTRNPHLYCAVHPHGGEGSCSSFVYDPAAAQQQQAF